MYATDFLERAFLNTFHGVDMTAPAKTYIGLFLNNPTDTGGSGIEINYNGYARQAVEFGTPVEGPGNTVSMKNTNNIIFARSDKNVGTVQYVGYFDSASGGNMLAYGKLTEDMAVQTNEAPTILENEIVLTVNLDMSIAYKKKLLNYFKGQSISGFTGHMALFNGSPESGGAEINGRNYERQAITFSTPADDSTGSSQITSTADVTFPKPPEEWGTMDHLVVYDAKTNGNPVFVKASPAGRLLKKGHTVIFQTGSIKLSLN